MLDNLACTGLTTSCSCMEKFCIQNSMLQEEYKSDGVDQF
jgi:hypothetical protein